MKKLVAIVALAIILVNTAEAQKKSKKDKSSSEQTSDDQSQSKKGKKEKPASTKPSKEAQQAQKDEEKRLKDELKNFSKNLQSYKHYKEEQQATLDSDQSQIHDLRAQLVTAKSKQSDLETRVNEQDGQLQACRQEKDSLTARKTEEDKVQPPASGTYYKVQLGMYHSFNINKDFEQPRTIGYEVVDGMNRYIIGYFTDSDAAMGLVKDIRKLGVRDAFVAKYIDGTRVFEWSENPKYKGKKVPNSLQEALEMNDKKGKKKK